MPQRQAQIIHLADHRPAQPKQPAMGMAVAWWYPVMVWVPVAAQGVEADTRHSQSL